jgi:alkylhydroperoxidase/carboxymuconolactone decarboxylase family protein YurZ
MPPQGHPRGSAVAVSRHEETLRRLSIRDDAYVQALLGQESANVGASALDGKSHSLVRLGALVALDATPASYLSAIESARAYGASDDEIVGCLVAVLPAVGVARVVSAAPKLGLALGYDVDAALERAERAD